MFKKFGVKNIGPVAKILYFLKNGVFAFPAGFIDAFHQKWWPEYLNFPGIPEFSNYNDFAPSLTFTKIPNGRCENVEIPVLVKSAADNGALRTIIRDIFNFQKKVNLNEKMKIFFVFGKGAEQKLR